MPIQKGQSLHPKDKGKAGDQNNKLVDDPGFPPLVSSKEGSAAKLDGFTNGFE